MQIQENTKFYIHSHISDKQFVNNKTAHTGAYLGGGGGIGPG